LIDRTQTDRTETGRGGTDGAEGPEPTPLTVTIVPHTHWDREWHEPFQVVRARLVALVDGVLPLLEDGTLPHFLLDGQTAPVDDHVAVRPADEARIRALVQDGRLAVGPFATLPDEFLVSGETLLRDLERGLIRSLALGADPTVGYLPDSFGHCAQMPQLLALAGLRHAVVWRGVPAAVDATAFTWEAPDGSAVRTEWLVGSYANARVVTHDPADLVALADSFVDELGALAPAPGRGGLLLMHGGDHRTPFPGLAHVVAGANHLQGRYHFVVRSLAAHLDAQPTDGLPRVQGELRSGAWADLLAGTISNRVDVHRAKATAELTLERAAEPLAALWMPAPHHPAALLAVAWDALVLNSAHDSACACSADPVVEAVLVRHAEVAQIAGAVTRDAMRWLAAQVDAPAGSVVVANPTPADRAGVVELELPAAAGVPDVCDGEGRGLLVQPVGPPIAPAGFLHVAVGRKLRWVVDLFAGDRFAGEPVAATGWSLDDGVHGLTVELAADGSPSTDVTADRDRLLALAHAGATVCVRSVRPARQRVLVLTPPVAGHGYTTLRPGAGPPGEAAPQPAAARAHTGGHGTIAAANELITVSIDPVAGTLAVRTADGIELAGLHRVVDGGDGGDTYTWSPPPGDEPVDRPVAVDVEIVEDGPVRARVLVTAHHRWPARAVGDAHRVTARSAELVDVTVRTTVDLHAGEAFVRLRTEWDDRAHDHRVRVHHPLPAPVVGSTAEDAFAVVHRGLDAEGGPHELATPTWPSRRFVDVTWPGADGTTSSGAGLTVVHHGLHEHEVVDGGRELAVTLLRAVGWLSRIEPHRRPKPAGPALATPAAQLDGLQEAVYALAPHRGRFDPHAAHALADAVLVPLATHAVGPSFATLPPVGRALRVVGAPVSAVTRVADGLLVRVHQPGDAPTQVVVELDGVAVGGRVVDLRGRELERFDAGGLALAPGRIATLVVDHPGVAVPPAVAST
jgi:mannosylglycerate hydrolase